MDVLVLCIIVLLTTVAEDGKYCQPNYLGKHAAHWARSHKPCVCKPNTGRIGNVSAKVNCTELADGNYEHTCNSFVTCTGGVSTNTVECPGELVYNKINGQCDDPVSVTPPCGTLLDCSITPDGKYADRTRNCEEWYTCHDMNYKGHTPCPKGTVFDERLLTCNYPHAVAPPCGTKIGF